MSNAAAHRLGAAVALAAAVAHEDTKNGVTSNRPIAAACVGFTCGTLPEVIEPAIHPNHRQFFHGLAFAGAVGYASYKLYKWEPETNNEKLMRFLLLTVAGAYLTHLVMDAFSPKGLPLVGRT